MNHPGVLGYPILTHTNGISQGMRISLQEIKGVPSKKTNHWCEVSGVKSFFFLFLTCACFFLRNTIPYFTPLAMALARAKKKPLEDFSGLHLVDDLTELIPQFMMSIYDDCDTGMEHPRNFPENQQPSKCRGLRVPGDAFQVSTIEAHDAMVKFGSMPQCLETAGSLGPETMISGQQPVERRTDMDGVFFCEYE